VKETSSSYDHSFDLSVGDLLTVEKAIDDIAKIKQTVFDEAVAEGASPTQAEAGTQKALAQISGEERKVAKTTGEVEDLNANLANRVKSRVGKAEVENLVNGRETSAETKKVVASELKGAIKTLQRKKDSISLETPIGLKNTEKTVSEASVQTQTSIIDEKISQYQQVLLALTANERTEQSKLRRSASPDPLQDTFIRQGGQVVRTAVGGFVQIAREADELGVSEYTDTQMSRLPAEIRANPEAYARMQMGYFLYKGLAGLGHGLSNLDDMTGNLASGFFHKVGEGFEWLGTQVRRVARDDLGFSQRIAQNIGDAAEIAAQIFAPAAVGSIAKSSLVAAGVTKFRSNVVGACAKVAERNVLRLDIIKEQEMVQRALATPGEWNGQFKLVKEISPTASGNEFASNVYCREVLFKDPKTQQMFRAFQRNDIDPGYVVELPVCG
jgi:hypothetical protein